MNQRHSHTNPSQFYTSGCASDDVFLCSDLSSVRDAFETIHGSTVFGLPRQQNDAVLVQEFATGQEYAIDTVSKNGTMKIAAIWQYDKRSVNGAPFVYYATKLHSAEHDDKSGECNGIERLLWDYLNACLSALDIRWGITHSEVIMITTPTGALAPRLVEVNCRQHNMNFLPLVMSGIGYNVFDMLLCSYLGGSGHEDLLELDSQEKLDWDILPAIPCTRMNAAMIHLVNTKEGTLTRVNEPALYEIQAMDSVWDMEVYGHFLELGNKVMPTINIKTDAGWVQLIHPDRAVFENDYQRIVNLMPTLFDVAER